MRGVIRGLVGALALAAAVGCGPTVEDVLPCAGVKCTAGTCQVQDGAPVCVCSAEDTAQGRTCERVVAPSGRTPDNDYPEGARELRPGERVQATLNDVPTGWRDLYLIRATAAQVLRLQVTLGSLRGFEVSLTPVAGGASLGGGGSDPRVRAFSLVGYTGDLLLEVRPSPQDAQGTYTVQLDGVTDDHGDTHESARLLASSTSAATAGALDYAGDTDVFRFDVPRTRWNALWCTLSSGSVQAVLEDAQGRAVTSLYCGWGGGRTDLTLAAGTYFVRVTGQQGSRYSVRLLADDHGDTFQDATPVALGADTAGNFVGYGDTDFFSFPVEAGHTYRVRTTTLNGASVSQRVWSGPASTEAYAYGPELVFSALTSGTYALQVSDGYEPNTYTVRIEDAGADDHGGTRETATPVEVGADVAGVFPAAGDVDVFSFAVQAKHVYRATITSTSANGVSFYARLWDEQGVLRAEGGGGGPFDLVAAHDGVAYLELTAYGPGTYRVRVEDLGADDHGDSWDTATPVEVGASTSGTFFTWSDHDFFSFQAEAGHTYRVRAWGGSAYWHWLRAWSGPNTAVREGPAPELLFAADFTGTHAVEVYGDGNGTTYWLSVEDLGGDDHGDSAAGATPVTLDTPVDGFLGASGDHDFFTFDALAGHGYRVRAADGSSTWHTVQVWDTYGWLLVSGGMPEVVAEPQADGPLYVDVCCGAQAVSYVLRVSDLGTEQGDTLATATPVALEEDVRGYFSPARPDVDVVRFEAQAGRVYRVRAADGTSSWHLLQVYGTDGTRLVSSQAQEVRVKAPADGPLYAEVSLGWSSPGTTWVLRVSDVGVDDRGDTEQDATPLVLVDGVGEVGGTNEASNDVDVFSLATEPGHIYAAHLYGYEVPRVTRPDGVAVDAVGTSVDGQPAVAFKAGAGGTLHALHVQVGGASYETSYWLRVRDLGTDDHGDSSEDATRLVLGRTVSGTSQYQNERDCFLVDSLAAGTTYQVTLGSSDARLEVRGPDGQLVWQSSWSGSFTAPRTGAYRFDVLGGWSPGAYTLKVD